MHLKSGAGAASPYLCLSRLVTASTSRAGHFGIPVVNRCTNYSRRNLNAGSKNPSLLQYRCNRLTKNKEGRHSATIIRPRKRTTFCSIPKKLCTQKRIKNTTDENLFGTLPFETPPEYVLMIFLYMT